MNDIQNKIYETIKLFNKHSIDNSNQTLTIECEIIDILDKALGIYKVSYLNNLITVHSTNNISYNVKDIVYVLIPEGDFAKEKIIIGKVTPSINIDNDELYNDNKYYYISDNLLTIKNKTYDLNTYKKSYNEYKAITDNTKQKLIEQYINDNTTFCLSCKIKTSLDKTQQAQGNYGIILSIPTTDSNNNTFITTEKIDISNMSGSPYDFYDYSLQNFYFNLNNNFTYDWNKTILYIFTNNFNTNETIDKKDIFIKDIGLYAAKAKEEDKTSGYSLYIKPSEGLYFADSLSNKKTLTAYLNINNKSTSLKKAKIYWFIENTSVKPGHPNYISNYGGYGWECLNDAEKITYADNGTKIKKYSTSNQSINNITIATRYKCVVIYNNLTISAIIELKNINYTSSIKLIGSQSYPSNIDTISISSIVYYEDFTDKEENRDLIKYSWSRYDEDNNYIDTDFTTIENNTILDNEYRTTVTFNPIEIKSSNIIKCTARKLNESGNNEIIGTASFTIVTDDNILYLINISGNNKIYKYDSDGDSPTSTHYDGINPLDELESLNFTVQNADGTEVPKIEIKDMLWKVSKATLMNIKDTIPKIKEDDDFNYYNAESALVYKLANKYNDSKAAAHYISLLLTIGDKVIETPVNINFIKEGNNGTNGTSYSVKFENEPIRFYCDSSKKYNNIEIGRLIPTVYKDTEITTENIKITYSMFDNNLLKEHCWFSIDNNGVIKTKNNFNINQTPINIIQVKITIAEKDIYAYYPIDVIITKGELTFKPYLTGGYSEVMYDSDGTNPSYNQSPFNISHNYITKKEWKIGKSLTQGKQQDSGYSAKPQNSFKGDTVNNYIIFNGKVASSSIQQEINKLTKELNNIKSQITTIEQDNNNLLELQKAFRYYEWIDILSKNNLLFACQVKYQDSLNKLKENIINYSDDVSAANRAEMIKIVDRIDNYQEEFEISKIENNNQDKDIINHINLLIDDVNVKYDALAAISEEDKKIYLELKEEISNFPTSLKIGKLAKNNLQNIFIVSSTKEKINEIDNVLENYFSNILEKKNNKIIISDLAKSNNEILLKKQEKIEQEISALQEDIASDGKDISIIHPIVMYYNRYGLENVNAWDGNKLIIKENEGYIIAPQVVAGTKNNDNSFTGITVGQKNTNSGAKDKIGLFGYNKGTRTIFLDAESGNAEFGASNAGQIIIDANKSVLKGGGLTINLSASPSIIYNNGNFSVDKDGKLKAEGIDVEGSINATYLNAKDSGNIGGWNINKNTLSSNNIELNANGQIRHTKDLWSLQKDGTAIFKQGEIGGWQIESNLLRSKSNNIKLKSDGSIESTNWNISTNGVATFTNVIISNSNGQGYNRSQMIWKDGTQTVFAVSPSGHLTASNANITGSVSATGGSVGGWSIQNGSINSQNNNTILSENGTVQIKGKEGSYFNMGMTTKDPNVSGLNVGSNGVKMNGQNGISGCANIGKNGAVLQFGTKTEDNVISTQSYFRIASSLLIIDRSGDAKGRPNVDISKYISECIDEYVQKKIKSEALK